VLAYRDKKVVGVFVRFRAPLHPKNLLSGKPETTKLLEDRSFTKGLGAERS
jgi:hypothetical protein